jgi:zinc transporter ZupT
LPAWALGLGPLLIIIAMLAAFVSLGGPGLGKRTGPPIEDLSVERTILRPGTIELVVRNTGPDAARVAQITVNDGFANFSGGDHPIGRLSGQRLRVAYPWIEGEAYRIALLTSTGATIDHDIAAAAETPQADAGFFGLMALLGLYVGVIPVALGMLWMPWVRRIPATWLRGVMALTVGLLAFLVLDGTLEGIDIAGDGAAAFGGAALVALGAAAAYLGLTALDGLLRRRREVNKRHGGSLRLALLVAIGIGIHNLGEGLAIGSAYAIGALALGTFLVVGFAIHNTTEGLAIVSPLASARPGARRLIALGLIAGAPAIPGAWIGATAYQPAIAALLLGVGVGAIVQVIQQLAPSMADRAGRALNPISAAGLIAGLAIMYATSLLVTL